MSAATEELIWPLPTRRATRRLGAALGSAVVAGDLIVLEGDLGAGKTFLTRAIARALGVPPATPVRSPTFALLHEYAARLPLVHGDLYRLEAAVELRELGLESQLSGAAVVILEWADRFTELLPQDGLWIWLSFRGEARQARLEGRGPAGRALLARVRQRLGADALP